MQFHQKEVANILTYLYNNKYKKKKSHKNKQQNDLTVNFLRKFITTPQGKSNFFLPFILFAQVTH